MRRGGRGSDLRGPWRRLDDPAIASAGYLSRGWRARNCVCVTVLAACSMAMSILLWSSRYRSNVHHFSSSGMVFPLYHYYRSGSHGMGWRENRARRGRRIQGMEGTDVLMNIRGGNRISFDDMEMLYIEMKLGVPPVKYNFHVDTGSGLSWVHCHIPTIGSTMTTWGPHGLYEAKDTSFVSCAGDTKDLCRQIQVSCGGEESCDSSHNYQCVFVANYVDESTYLGLVVNESFTLAMEDKSERNLFGSFGYSLTRASVLILHHSADGEVVCFGRGYPMTSVRRVDNGNTNDWVELCMVDKVRVHPEILPLLTDGVIGLGNCKGTLLDQWTTSKFVSQSVLGVCLAKGVDWTTLRNPATPVGYISMGMDFKDKFDISNSVWSKLTNPGDTNLCSYIVNLLYISFSGLQKAIHSEVLIDTGSEATVLAPSVSEPLMEALEAYASIGGYLKVPDNRYYVDEDQRVCWQPPDLILAKGSPIQDFLPIIFAFEGIDSATQRDTFQYLVVEPAKYLIWDALTKKLCVTILQDDTYSISNIGVDMMREHLFVHDFENQRIRWQSDNCELN